MLDLRIRYLPTIMSNINVRLRRLQTDTELQPVNSQIVRSQYTRFTLEDEDSDNDEDVFDDAASQISSSDTDEEEPQADDQYEQGHQSQGHPTSQAERTTSSTQDNREEAKYWITIAGLVIAIIDLGYTIASCHRPQPQMLQNRNTSEEQKSLVDPSFTSLEFLVAIALWDIVNDASMSVKGLTTTIPRGPFLRPGLGICTIRFWAHPKVHMRIWIYVSTMVVFAHELRPTSLWSISLSCFKVARLELAFILIQIAWNFLALVQEVLSGVLFEFWIVLRRYRMTHKISKLPH